MMIPRPSLPVARALLVISQRQPSAIDAPFATLALDPAVRYDVLTVFPRDFAQRSRAGSQAHRVLPTRNSGSTDSGAVGVLVALMNSHSLPGALSCRTIQIGHQR